MLPLPTRPFEIYRLEKSKASKTGKVRLDSNTYSSAPQFANREIWVKAGAHQVQILDEEFKLITTHPRLYGKNGESMDWHPYLTVLSKRPNALKYTGFYGEMPDIWQDYLAKCSYDEKKAGLQALIKIITETDIDTASKTLSKCLEQETANADSILLNYYRLSQPDIMEEIQLASHIPKLENFKTDVSSYDQLLSGGKTA
jgi:hypothetical protein